MSREEIYISIDVETNGPIPGKYSMLSLGAAAYLLDKTLVDTFSINFKTLPNAIEHPETMAWWLNREKTYNLTRVDQVEPKEAMSNFLEWIEDTTLVEDKKYKPVCVCYPSGFDFTFIYWYFSNFLDECPFGFSALDLKSYACAVMGTPFKRTTKSRMPKHWFDKFEHTHIAVDDAIEQGALAINMIRNNTG